MTWLNSWLADYPSTNARLFVSACLDVLYVVLVLAGMLLGRPLDDGIVWTIGGFLLALGGLGVAQFTAKRRTEIVTPPQTTAEHSGGSAA